MNIGAFYGYNSYRNYGIHLRGLQQSIRPVSSGYRIGSAADDAAGLSISQGMRGQISGMSAASRNASDAISMAQTAEGALDSTGKVVNRMRELAVQSSNGTLSASDREAIDKEFQQLKEQINYTSSSTQFNGQQLLDGTLGGKTGRNGPAELGVTGFRASAGNLFSGDAKFTISTENGVSSVTAKIGDRTVTNQIAAGDTATTFNFGAAGKISMEFSAGALKDGVISGVGFRYGSTTGNLTKTITNSADSKGTSFQIGANGAQDQRVSLGVRDMSAQGLGLADLDVRSAEGAGSAIAALDKAAGVVSSERANIGATQNRLESIVRNLGVTNENTTASESRIRDADMALAIMNLTRSSIQQQSSVAMLSHGLAAARSNMLGLLMR